MEKIVIDEGTWLREIEMDDAAGMFSLIDSQRDYLGRWLPFIPYTRTAADSEAFIASVIGSRPHESGNYVFAIIVDGQFAGTVGLKDTDKANLKTEIGYWLGEQYQGKGIVTRAVVALCDLAFGEMGMNRVQIQCAVGNTPSSNIPKRLGFVLEGIQRDGERTAEGGFYDIEVYSKLRKEWLEQRDSL